jgi:hypothetical protein
MSPGRRRSTATFICWMVARFTLSGLGDRMKVFGGRVTRPELRSGIGTGGSPFSMGNEEYCSAVWLKKMSKGNDPRIGRDQGSGLKVRPYPARSTVSSLSR